MPIQSLKLRYKLLQKVSTQKSVWHSVALCTVLTVMVGLSMQAQSQYPKDYFRFPLNLPMSLSASFGEIRPNHFHSGLDLRIGGKVGEPVYAAADGYVSRIAVSPWGGGKVLYLTHANGFSTVYMHLNDFCGDIGLWVYNYQYSHRVYAFDTTPTTDTLWVKKGQLVAHAGNTGGSGGPHLHFEVRYASNDQPINPLYFGFAYTDPIAPTIRGVKIYPVDNGSTVNGLSKAVKLQGKAAQRKDTVKVSGRFYTGIYTTDVSEPSNGKNGIEKIELYIDGQLASRYGVGTFLFEETRAVNAIVDYPTYRSTGEYYILTRSLRGNRNAFVKNEEGHGVFSFASQGVHRLEYVVSDYKGNKTKRMFFIDYTPQPSVSEAETLVSAVDSQMEAINYFSRHSFMRAGFVAEFEENTIYDNDYLVYSVSKLAGALSPMHNLALVKNPLPAHKGFTVSIAEPPCPEALRSKLVVVCKDGKKVSALPSRLVNGCVTGVSKGWGGFAVMLDTVAPTLKPLNFANGKIVSAAVLTVKVGDNLSGLSSYHCFLNEEWVLSEYDGKTSTLSTEVKSRLRKGKNSLRYVLTDAVGNVSAHTFTILK